MAADLGATWHPDGARRLLVLVILTTFAGGCGAETVHTDHPPVHRDSPDHPAAPTMDTADLPPLEDVESMPPPGMQVDWAKAFPRIDVNGDGVATELELARFLDHSHMTLAAKEREMMLVATMERLQPEFKKHDADGDGVVTFEELWASKPADDAVMRDRRRRQFVLADEDGDGKLGPAEFVLLSHPDFAHDKQSVYELLANDRLEAADQDRDGEVTWAEWAAEKAREREAFERDAGLKHSDGELADIKAMDHANFQVADADGNGVLTLKELVGREQHTHQFAAATEAKELVAFLDGDSDGAVSMDEFEKGFHHTQPHLHQFFAHEHEEL